MTDLEPIPVDDAAAHATRSGRRVRYRVTLIVALVVGLAVGAWGRSALVDGEACRAWMYEVAFEAKDRAEHQSRDFDDVARRLAGAQSFLDQDARRIERPTGCP